MFLIGLEPVTFRVLSGCDNYYTTEIAYIRLFFFAFSEKTEKSLNYTKQTVEHLPISPDAQLDSFDLETRSLNFFYVTSF